MAELESVNDPAASSDLRFYTALPSSSNIVEFWPECQHFVALPHDLQRIVTSQVAAIHIGFNLIFALVNSTQLKRGTSTGPAAFENHQPWVLDSMLTMWQHFKRWTTGPNKHPLYDDIIALYLRLLEAIAFPKADPGDCFSNSPKATQALASSLSAFLEGSQISRLSEYNQIRLAACFTRLRGILSPSPSEASDFRCRQDIARTVTLKTLETSIARLCQQVEPFSCFHKDLQVRVAKHHRVKG